jgi:hypothetical protein
MQSGAKLLERHGLSPDAREPSDAAFSRLWSTHPGANRPADAETLLAHMRQRTTPRFFASFDDRQATVAALRRWRPEAERATIARADRIRAGRFDLLGEHDLSFGDPIAWQWDPVANRHAPQAHWSLIPYLDPAVVGDHKLVWELNRHQYLVTLGKAYWYTGDEAYARTFATHLTSWMDANLPKQGINWASSLEVAFRAIAWLWALHFFRQSPALTPGLCQRLLKALYVHGRHLELYLSTYFSPNTHLTGEALGLVYLGTLLPEFQSGHRWREAGWRILTEQLPRHALPDGVYFERATCYHRYTADFYLHALLLAERNGGAVREHVADRLELLLDHLMYVTRPDGRTPLIGDDDGGRLMPLDERAPSDFRATLATGALALGRSDYAFVAGEPSEEIVWLLGSAAYDELSARTPAPPARTSVAFRDGGYFVMRDRWAADADYMILDCGPHGAMNCGHAHADALAFELAARGCSMLVDPGTYTYTRSPRDRNWYRHSAMHSTVTVDGASSSVPGGPFSWYHVASTELSAWTAHARFDYVAGRHDGFTRLPSPAVHDRAVLFLKGDYWVIRDRVRSDGTHESAVHFHCAPGVTVERESDAVCMLRCAHPGHPAALRLAAFGAGGTFTCRPGSVSPSYGRREPAVICTYTVASTGSQEIITFLMPAERSGQAPEVTEHDALGGRAFAVRTAHSSDVVLVRTPSEIRSPDIASDAEWVWIRSSAPGLVTEFLLINGTWLTLRGLLTLRTARRTTYIVGRMADGRWHIETENATPVTMSGPEQPPAPRGPAVSRPPATSNRATSDRPTDPVVTAREER